MLRTARQFATTTLIQRERSLFQNFKTTAAFANVNISLLEPDTEVRKILVASMRQSNFRSLAVRYTLVELSEALMTGHPDIIMLSLDHEARETCALVRAIRGNEIGTDPFPILIALVTSPNPALAKLVLSAGFDDILIKPLAPATLIERTIRFASGRKPFVITSDYIGPDRRDKARTDGGTAPSFEPPNPVLLRVKGGSPEAAKLMSVDHAIALLNMHKMERDAQATELLAQSIFELFSGGFDDTTLTKARMELEKLILVTEDVQKRSLRGGSYGAATKPSELLNALANRLYAETGPTSDFAFSPDDVRLLPEIARAVIHGIGPGKDEGEG